MATPIKISNNETQASPAKAMSSLNIKETKVEPIIPKAQGVGTETQESAKEETVMSSQTPQPLSPPPKLQRVPSTPVPPLTAAGMHLHEFAPRIVVCGVGGAGGNAVNNMIARGLSGEFLRDTSSKIQGCVVNFFLRCLHIAAI